MKQSSIIRQRNDGAFDWKGKPLAVLRILCSMSSSASIVFVDLRQHSKFPRFGANRGNPSSVLPRCRMSNLEAPLFAQYHFQPGLDYPAGFVAHAGAGGQGKNPIPDARGDLCLDDGLFRRVLQEFLPGLPLAEALTVGDGIQLGPIGRENIKAEDTAVHQQVDMGMRFPIALLAVTAQGREHGAGADFAAFRRL